MIEKVSYTGWPNCIRIGNDKLELIVTTDVGPRIIRFGYINEQNMFKEFTGQLGLTGGNEWRAYGGHRLWHSPEHIARTYWPDNVPVKYDINGNTLKLQQVTETNTGIQKEFELTFNEETNSVLITHRLVNRNLWDVELAPWCLTVMTVNGRAIIPQEPYRPHPEYLLPARPLVLWHYTNMQDERFTWGKKYIQIKQNPQIKTKQKIGLLNKQGWVAYYLSGTMFVKHYEFNPIASYPDYGCNTECFIDTEILEIETLGPVTKLAPEGKVEHQEKWNLYKVELTNETEDTFDRYILPLI